ncbi:MAG: hypothetical protein V4640_05325 [Verrucomicrobiota bacterium]
MKSCRAIVRLLAVLGTLLLVSCIDGREEYWIHADGSGRAEITYSLPAAAARFQGGADGVEKLLTDFFANTPAISSSTHAVTVKDDRLTVSVTARFDSVVELHKISDNGTMGNFPSSADGLTGDIKLDLTGREVSASRVISAGKALPMASLMPAAQFAAHRLCYIVHLPVAAKVSNATRIENGGRTLVWDYPLAEALRRPLTLRFQAPVPIPMRWLVGGIAVIVVGVLALFVLWRKWRRTR